MLNLMREVISGSMVSLSEEMMSATCCDLSEFLAALADETRQHILVLLGEREMNVNELSEQFAVTQPTISHHLAILRRAHLVIPRREGQYIFYRANPACVAECCREIWDRFSTSDRSEQTTVK